MWDLISGATVVLKQGPKRRSEVAELEKSSEERRELYERHAGWRDCGFRESLRDYDEKVEVIAASSEPALHGRSLIK